MQTVQIKSEGTFNFSEFMKGIEFMTLEELEKVMGKVLYIRAKKIAPSLSKRETELFQQINATLSEETWRRFDKLDEKRELKTLTKKEHKELLSLIEELDDLELKRTECLVELSKIRGIPFRELVQKLGIKPRQKDE